MNNWKNFIAISCLLIFSIGTPQSADAQQNLAQQAFTIFQQNCLNCHGNTVPLPKVSLSNTPHSSKMERLFREIQMLPNSIVGWLKRL